MPKSIQLCNHLHHKSKRNELQIGKEKNHQLTPIQIQLFCHEWLSCLDCHSLHVQLGRMDNFTGRRKHLREIHQRIHHQTMGTTSN